MTSRLPDEILLAIFEQLDYTELLNCQQVCRHWYPLIHIQLLREVKLTTDKAIEQFNATFDRETNQSYFNAVNTIRICRNEDRSRSTVLKRKTIEKLFFRFPNLQNVYLDRLRLIENFNEDLCNVFLSHCPKLNIFDILDHDMGKNYGRLWKKVRPLITHIRLSSDNGDSGLQAPIEFITQCPRLQSIFCEDQAIDAFDKFLPTFGQPSNIRKLHFALEDDIDANFGTTYFTTKPKEIQDLIRKNLSNIADLHFTCLGNIINTMNFVAKHCTGLRNFGVKVYFEELEGEGEQDSFCKSTLNAVFSTKGSWDVKLRDLPFTCLSSNFACLAQNMFQKVPQIYKQSNYRVLNLKLDSAYLFTEQPPCVNLIFQSTQSPFSRNVKIQADSDTDFNDIVTMFKSASAMGEVDAFNLECAHLLDLSVDVEMYLDLLSPMTSLKEVLLNIPRNFMETALQQPYAGPVFRQVERATFTANGLKRLDIVFNGLRETNVDESLFDLSNYSLERLALDMVPVQRATEAKKPGFFVLEVEILDNNERRFYAISHNLAVCKKINLNSSGFKNRNDYSRVRLIVTYLKQLALLGKTKGRISRLA